MCYILYIIRYFISAWFFYNIDSIIYFSIFILNIYFKVYKKNIQTMKTMPPPETKNVTVEILNIQEKEKQHFDTWFKNAVVLDPLITSDLTEFYKSYVDYVIFTYQIVPLSKKNFSKVLKNELSDWTNQ